MYLLGDPDLQSLEFVCVCKHGQKFWNIAPRNASCSHMFSHAVTCSKFTKSKMYGLNYCSIDPLEKSGGRRRSKIFSCDKRLKLQRDLELSKL